VARVLLLKNYFSGEVIKNLKKSGKYFLQSGIVSIMLFIALWLKNL